MASRFAFDRSPSTPLRDRLIAGAGSAAILALTGYALLLNPANEAARKPETQTTLLALRPPPPPPTTRPIERPVRKRAAGRPSPPNLRNKATPLVVPPPPPIPVTPPPLVVAPHAGTGMAANNGAADRAGPGQGAGGQGNGYGAGGTGDGEGDTPPRLIHGYLKFSYLPAALRAAGASGQVGVRYHVETNGRVTGCAVTASSGNPGLDQATCALIEERFRYAPGHDAHGRRFAATIIDNHSWIIDRLDDDVPAEADR